MYTFHACLSCLSSFERLEESKCSFPDTFCTLWLLASAWRVLRALSRVMLVKVYMAPKPCHEPTYRSKMYKECYIIVAH